MIAMRFLKANVLERKALNRNLSWGFPLGNLLPKTRVLIKHRVLERKRRPNANASVLGTQRFRTLGPRWSNSPCSILRFAPWDSSGGPKDPSDLPPPSEPLSWIHPLISCPVPFFRSLGNGVRKNGVRNQCPYRRCGVDTEIPHRPPFEENSAGFWQSVWLPRSILNFRIGSVSSIGGLIAATLFVDTISDSQIFCSQLEALTAELFSHSCI